jgi:hypothetical protein
MQCNAMQCNASQCNASQFNSYQVNSIGIRIAGSIASFRQQAGRAGRREQQSMSIYVAFDGPMDQYFMRNPRSLFDKPIEAAHVPPPSPPGHTHKNTHCTTTHIGSQMPTSVPLPPPPPQTHGMTKPLTLAQENVKKVAHTHTLAWQGLNPRLHLGITRSSPPPSRSIG